MSVHPRLGWAVVWVALGVTPGCYMDGGPLRATQPVSFTRALDANGTFVLGNTNGRVEIDTWKEPRVRIEAEKRASRRDVLDEVKVDVSGEGSRVTVDTHLPKGFFGHNAEVRYHVTVPEGARVEVHTVNGSVEIEGVSGKVSAQTTNGSVEVDGSAASVAARTTNGSIRVAARSAAVDRLELETVNGAIRLELPADARGRVEGQTVNGGISSDFPLEVQGKWGPKHLSGELGSGGGRVSLRTVNGSIHLNRI